MNLIYKFFILSTLILFTHSSLAIVQLRASYGLGQPEGFESSSIDYDTGEIGADIIVSIPLIPIVFGLRYEKITSDVDENGVQQEIDLGRISILGGYRLIDNFVYVGILGSFGIINDGEMTYENTGQVRDIDMSNSATLALEGGVNLNDFILGLELGYRYGKDKGQGASDFEYNGTYVKAVLGYEF